MQPLKHVFSCNMHQSIPAVPIPPPRGNHGAFAWGISKFYRGQGLGISIPRGEPRDFNTHVFYGRVSLSGRTRPLSQTGLSVRV